MIAFSHGRQQYLTIIVMNTSLKTELLKKVKQLPILEVADSLGVTVKNKQAMCFTGHDKATPSLSFRPQTNRWKCFGACGKGGDGIQLVREILGLDFISAVDWLGSTFKLGLVSESNQLKSRIHAQSPGPYLPKSESTGEWFPDPEVYSWFLDRCGEIKDSLGLSYLESHAISNDAAKHFNLRELRKPEKAFDSLVKEWGIERIKRCGITRNSKFGPSLLWNRYTLLFPFFEGGSITYIQGRPLGGDIKYLNLKGITKPLFNQDKLLTMRPGDVIHICEGVPDALSLETCGLNAVAVLGATSFLPQWVELFLKFRIVVCPDGDRGGETFEKTITKFFLRRSKGIKTLHIPEGMDVAAVLAQIKNKNVTD